MLAPVWLPIAALVLLLLAPLCFWFTLRGTYDHLRFRHRLRRLGRILDWETVQKRLSEGNGSLLVECGYKGYAYAWWVGRELPADCPLPPVRESEWIEGYRKLQSPQVRQWCEAALPSLATDAYLVGFARGWKAEIADRTESSAVMLWFEDADRLRATVLADA
jgi:hypothetical protein